ncbi:MAG: hypothetical protein KGD70_07185, partial [Candidatus Lokiarchaeota archaeon]|nr:hypothetical protein [Candidatus Lokiarchaeota archaeon]
GYDLASIPLGSGWNGYKLSAEINELTDERNWNNGTFNYGVDDGSDIAGENDTTWISNSFQDWTFGYNDTGYGVNPMSGNYLSNIGGQDCLELRIDGDREVIDPWYTYDPDDKGWWSSSIQINRGKIIDSSLNFDLYPNYLAQFNSWAFSIYLNSKRVYSIGTYTLFQYGGNNWHSFSIPQNIWTNSSNIFPNEPLNNSILDISLVLECVGGGNFSGFANEDFQRIYVDNVELNVEAEVLPSYVGLIVNQTAVQDIDWGKGVVEIDGNWESTNIFANFSSTDVGELGTYSMNLKTNLNLYGVKHTPDTNYETDVGSLGTIFSVENESSVNWETYGFIAIPTGYSESEMILNFPTDVIITNVFEPENPSTNILSLCDDSIPGRLLIPVDSISPNPDGFWKFEATAPNYCEELHIFNNATGMWVPNNSFLSGEYINITARITNSLEVSSYIQNTNVRLQIRYPNGTLWTDRNQITSVDSTGFVKFNPFQIPSTPPEYEVGEYEVIVTWNNSYSSFSLNETGVLVKKFQVTHYSTLIPDIEYYENIADGSILNIRVSFSDLENFNAIENANVYTSNFTHPSLTHYFSEISPGYYFLEFNVTGAPNAGNNTLTIFAISPSYVSSEVNITIDIIKNTLLVVDNDYLANVPIEQNFTIQFNYTEQYSGVGIVASKLSTNWVGESFFSMVTQGVYTLTCNASGPGYQSDKLYSMIITVEADKYRTQSIPIRVFITEKASFLELFINGTKKNEDEVVSFEFWQKINITVTYRDALSNHLSGASIKLTGGGLLVPLIEAPIREQYSFLLNASELGLGVDYLSILANISNYNPQSIRFITEITERKTLLEVYLNGEDKTGDPSINIAINKLLNITIKYTDLNGNHIENATVEMFGAISDSLNEDTYYDQYTYIFNTSILDIGVRIIAISAEKENHIFQSEDLRIEIRRILTNISTVDGISRISKQPGEDVRLRIVLEDLDFGGFIRGGVVSYSGDLGSGILTDGDGDGIYEVVFENIAEGTFKIVIDAFYGDNYEFESYEVTISAIRPAGEALLILILTVAITSAAVIIVGYIYAYQKYLKYPKPVRKVRKYQKTLDKTKDPRVNIAKRENAFKATYEEELRKSSKIIRGKPEKPVAKPEIDLKKSIEKSEE